MKYIIAFIVLFFSFTTTTFSADYFVHEKSGIKIYYQTTDDMFPESWRRVKIRGRATSLDLSELDRSIEIIFKALDKYPVAVLQNNLSHIFIFKEMKFYGQPYGGTNSNDVVYLTNSGISNGYTDQYLEQLFHAEFSSILLRNYAPESFDKRWCRINDDDFEYGKGGVYEIKKGKSGLIYDEYYYNAGFLYEYAMSGSENDLNSIAKNLFCPIDNFWEVYKNYEELRLKINLAIELYQSIDNDFCLDYFRKFGKKD